MHPRPDIDWLAGFGVTAAWSGAVLAALVYVYDAVVWPALATQCIFAWVVTWWVIYMSRRFEAATK